MKNKILLVLALALSAATGSSALGQEYNDLVAKDKPGVRSFQDTLRQLDIRFYNCAFVGKPGNGFGKELTASMVIFASSEAEATKLALLKAEVVADGSAGWLATHFSYVGGGGLVVSSLYCADLGIR